MHIAAPGRNSDSPVLGFIIVNPVISDGIRSGVNWIRLQEPLTLSERAVTSLVFPTPGTSSISTWPPESSAAVSFRITSRLPMIERSMLSVRSFIFSFIGIFPFLLFFIVEIFYYVTARHDTDEFAAVVGDGDEVLLHYQVQQLVHIRVHGNGFVAL